MLIICPVRAGVILKRFNRLKDAFSLSRASGSYSIVIIEPQASSRFVPCERELFFHRKLYYQHDLVCPVRAGVILKID